jgi:muramidase (phage lysozyme)
MARLDAAAAGGGRVLAFLDMLAWSEIGPALLAASDDGYNVMVGSTPARPNLFASYADHPQVFVALPGLRIKSSAAGRYQFLARTWDALARTIELTDFTPANQDRGAIQLLRECRALPHEHAGALDAALAAAAPIWASLPGAGYGQHENHRDALHAAYRQALDRYTVDFAAAAPAVATPLT